MITLSTAEYSIITTERIRLIGNVALFIFFYGFAEQLESEHMSLNNFSPHPSGAKLEHPHHPSCEAKESNRVHHATLANNCKPLHRRLAIKSGAQLGFDTLRVRPKLRNYRESAAPRYLIHRATRSSQRQMHACHANAALLQISCAKGATVDFDARN